MNPYIARELMNERSRDLLAEAQRARLVSRLRSGLRGRRQEAFAESVSVPVIPDYVHELVGDTEVDARNAC